VHLPVLRESLRVIHVRVVSPPDVTERLVAELESHSGVIGLIVLEGVARRPAGDSVEFDVVTAEANVVLAQLRRLDLDQRGSIAIGSPTRTCRQGRSE
jgi:hypothetical protein